MEYTEEVLLDEVDPEPDEVDPEPDEVDPEPDEEEDVSDVEMRALEVLAGKWGAGESARRRLTAHGINADAVLAEVAKLNA